MSEPSPQRRRFRRRTVRVLVEYLSDAGLCRETATTLGAGGLFIESQQPLPKGTALKLSFSLPGSNVRHDLEGSVAWAHMPSDTESGSAGMGIAFSDRGATAKLARELQQLDD